MADTLPLHSPPGEPALAKSSAKGLSWPWLLLLGVIGPLLLAGGVLVGFYVVRQQLAVSLAAVTSAAVDGPPASVSTVASARAVGRLGTEPAPVALGVCSLAHDCCQLLAGETHVDAATRAACDFLVSGGTSDQSCLAHLESYRAAASSKGRSCR